MARRFDTAVFWRALAVQLGAVTVLSLVLVAAIRDEDTFRHWGELIGPLGWAAACLATWALVARAGWRLPLWSAVLGGLATGLVSAAIGVGLGAHWLGVALAILGFAAWFAVRARRTAG